MAVGSRLQPERDLAAEYGIAYLTVRRGMRQLRERGLITTVHGMGPFVADLPQEGGERSARTAPISEAPTVINRRRSAAGRIIQVRSARSA